MADKAVETDAELKVFQLEPKVCCRNALILNDTKWVISTTTATHGSPVREKKYLQQSRITARSMSPLRKGLRRKKQATEPQMSQ